MANERNTGLLIETPLPFWVKRFRFFKAYRENPIFLRNIIARKPKRGLDTQLLVIIALSYSIILNTILRILSKDWDLGGFGFAATILFPGYPLILLTISRLLLTALITIPRMIRKDLESGGLGMIFSTPLKEREIINGYYYYGIFQGITATGNMIIILLSLLIPYLLISNDLPMKSIIEWEKSIDFYDIYIGSAIFAIIVIGYNIACNLACLFSIPISAIAASLMTVISSYVLIAGSIFLGHAIAFKLYYGTAKISNLFGHEISNSILMPLTIQVLWLLNVAIIFSINLILVKFLIYILAISRRPGFYKDDGLNAGGLSRKESKR